MLNSNVPKTFSPNWQAKINTLYLGQKLNSDSKTIPSPKLPSKPLMKKRPTWVKGLSLMIVSLGALVGFQLNRFNQDLRQQASSGVYPGTGNNNPTTVNPWVFAESATVANTDTFVVTPEELGYDPDTVEIPEDRIFDYSNENNNQVWGRGFEWHDRETHHEYHSTIIAYNNTNDPTVRVTDNYLNKTGVDRLDAGQIHLNGINSAGVSLFQAKDDVGTINLAFSIGNYIVVLKTKNTPFDVSMEKLEIMANLLIQDLTGASQVTVQQ